MDGRRRVRPYKDRRKPKENACYICHGDVMQPLVVETMHGDIVGVCYDCYKDLIREDYREED